MALRRLIGILLIAGLVSACATPETLTPRYSDATFKKSSTPADSIVAQIPDYRNQLQTVKGKAKAIISAPENSQRATLYFSSNRRKSLVTAKNGIGITAGKMLSDRDSLIVYNKLDNYVRRISLRQAKLTNINSLASINLLDLLNSTADAQHVAKVWESHSTFMLEMSSGRRVYVSKKSGRVQQVHQPKHAAVPYSYLIYDAYAKVDGLMMPRRITIYSADESSKVDLLIQSLEINPSLVDLHIDIPDDIKTYHQ